MFTVFARCCSIQFQMLCDKSCCMKDSLCSPECSRYKDSDDTKNKTKKLILRFVMTWQRFVTSIGVVAALGPKLGETWVKTGPVLIGLNVYICVLL